MRHQSFRNVNADSVVTVAVHVLHSIAVSSQESLSEEVRKRILSRMKDEINESNLDSFSDWPQMQPVLEYLVKGSEEQMTAKEPPRRRLQIS